MWGVKTELIPRLIGVFSAQSDQCLCHSLSGELSPQANGTKSTSFLTYKEGSGLVPLACEDVWRA